MKSYAIILFGFTLILSCKSEIKDKATPKSSKPDFIHANLDTTVSPADDFFQYANGGWIKNNPIPNDQSSWGIGNLVLEENIKRLREISEKAAAVTDAKPGSPDQMIGDFWSSGMDTAKIEAEGLKYVQPYLDRIDNVKEFKELMPIVSELKNIGSNTFFSDFVNQDEKNSDVMIYTFYQGGTGLPEREYYFKSDSATIQIRNQYTGYICLLYTSRCV